MMGASLLISFTGPKSLLFAMAHAAGTPARPLTPMRTHTHAHAHAYGHPNAPHELTHECGKPIARGHARTRTHPPEMLPPSLSASCTFPHPSGYADLWPFIVADVGHDKLFCEEFCAGADVNGEMHSRSVLGQEVLGTMSTRGRMWGTQSTHQNFPNLAKGD